jgi:hypothetical protein
LSRIINTACTEQCILQSRRWSSTQIQVSFHWNRYPRLNTYLDGHQAEVTCSTTSTLGASWDRDCYLRFGQHATGHWNTLVCTWSDSTFVGLAFPFFVTVPAMKLVPLPLASTDTDTEVDPSAPLNLIDDQRGREWKQKPYALKFWVYWLVRATSNLNGDAAYLNSECGGSICSEGNGCRGVYSRKISVAAGFRGRRALNVAAFRGTLDPEHRDRNCVCGRLSSEREHDGGIGQH